LYALHFSRSATKEFKKIDKHNQLFLTRSLDEFIANFNDTYEQSLMQKGKIKKLQGQKEVLYRLKLRSYRVVYQKQNEKLIILVVHVTSREGAYK